MRSRLRHVHRALLALSLLAPAALPAQQPRPTPADGIGERLFYYVDRETSYASFVRNVDRITGEVKRLDRGRLEFSTDDAGTLYLEWDKLVSVVATRIVEVVTSDGLRFLGSLGPASARSLAVVGPGGVTTLAMRDVTIIRPIGS